MVNLSGITIFLFPNQVFTECKRAEKQAQEYWNNGKKQEALDTLSDFTFGKLREALTKASKALSSAEEILHR